MKLNCTLKLFIFIIFTFFAWIPAQSQFGQDSLVQISPSIYEITGLGGNVVFKITSNGVILVDAGVNLEAGMKIKEYVAKTTSQPIKYILLTHYHFDHTRGLAAFGDKVTIVGQSNTLDNMKKDAMQLEEDIQKNIPLKLNKLNQDLAAHPQSNEKNKALIDTAIQAETNNLELLKKIKIIYPTILYDKEWSVILGTDTIQMIYPGNAHTNGDSWILFKNDHMIHLGDMLFSNCYPYIDVMGDTKNWSNQLNTIATKDDYIFIPGHGNISKSIDVKRLANYLVDLNRAVANQISLGKSLEEMKKTINLDSYADFGFSFLRDGNIEAVYNEQTRK